MATKKKTRLAPSTSSLKIRTAAKRLQSMSMAGKIQLMVRAKLMTQKEADAAICKLANGKAT